MKKVLKSNQMMLLILFAVLWLCFGLVNPTILSMANVFALLRNSIVPAIFSLGLMLIMAQGGTDLSYNMIGAFASYVTIYLITGKESGQMPLPVIFLIAMVIGALLQLINWFLIDRIHLESFISTLGMQLTLKGFLLAFVSTAYIYTLPDSLNAFSKQYLATASFTEGTESVLHIGILFVIVLYVIVHMILQHTNFGRQIYAIGGDIDSARRAGIHVSAVRFATFAMAGAICGIGGVMHDALIRYSLPYPTDIVGQELLGIAAVTLGMGAVPKARGMVAGTLLGILLLKFVSTNLIMLGIPSYWQDLISGIIILLGLLSQVKHRKRVRVTRKEAVG